MLRIATYCLLLLFAANAAGQSLVKCRDKTSFWIIKGNGKKFAILLHGDVAEGEVPELMNVEETALHYNLISKATYVKKGGGNTDPAVLTRFIKGEEKILGEKMKPAYEMLRLTSGKPFLLWHHDWHGTEEAVEQQVHVTIILGETIVWLSAPKFTGQDIKKLETFLSETIANVQIIKSTDGLCKK